MDKELLKQWLGYFEDIVDDCKTMKPYIPPQYFGMVDGISSVASQGVESIKNQLKENK